MESRKLTILTSFIALAILIAIPLFGPSKYVMHILILVLLNVVLGQSWNLLGGFGGQISFGHAAMYGIGAYTSTLLYLKVGLSPWIPSLAEMMDSPSILRSPPGWLSISSSWESSSVLSL